MPETFLGLRHGPMSFLDHEILVLCFLSSDPRVHHYERDLLAELRTKNRGRILIVDLDPTLYDHGVLSLAPNWPTHCVPV